MKTLRNRILYIVCIASALLYLSSCRSTRVIQNDSFKETETRAAQIIQNMPDYRDSLLRISGKGRAIVSEPGNTERVTVLFSSNRQKSLLTVRNSLGIEGGQLLTDGDSLLIYNKIDEFARKIPIRGGNLSRIDHLASLNVLEMLNYTVETGQVANVLENEQNYQLTLESGAKIVVNKQNHTILQVTQPDRSQLPYSRIVYEAYASVNEFMLPRRITIFSADRSAKVAFLIQSLEINPRLDSLTIKLPDNITIYYQ